jgi:ABC-type uncharacterized transport system ATPase subunit
VPVGNASKLMALMWRCPEEETTAARVLAEVTAVTEVVDLTLEEPAIEDIVRTLYGVG